MADCLDRLREIAAAGQDDPRVAAGQIMREFKASAGRVEYGSSDAAIRFAYSMAGDLGGRGLGDQRKLIGWR